MKLSTQPINQSATEYCQQNLQTYDHCFLQLTSTWALVYLSFLLGQATVTTIKPHRNSTVYCLFIHHIKTITSYFHNIWICCKVVDIVCVPSLNSYLYNIAPFLLDWTFVIKRWKLNVNEAALLHNVIKWWVANCLL